MKKKRVYCGHCGKFLGFTSHNDHDRYQCGLCHLDWISDLVNALRSIPTFPPQGDQVQRFIYDQIFLNDDSDNELVAIGELPKAALRLLQACINDDLVFIAITGGRMILSNEENMILESARLTLTEWT